ASTPSSLRPSRRSASRLTAARGCGVSTSTRSPTSTCSRRAARARESPSGIPVRLALLESGPAVARRCTLAAAIGLAAALPAGNVAAAPVPYLRSVSAVHRHVVAVFRLGTDQTARQIVVAASPKTGPNGALVSTNVRLRETIGR